MKTYPAPHGATLSHWNRWRREKKQAESLTC
jgi:hypothetical protein